MSLYLKYRPPSLESIKGNSEIVHTLQGMLNNIKTCPHVFLLHGPTGCGKTTFARIIAQQLGCKGTDIREVDSADFRGIDTIREIRRHSNFKAMEGLYRTWIIDECHKLTNDAQNALLKLLEDTPPHVFFVLCTTEPQKLIETVKGRCISLQVKPLTETQMFGLLRHVTRLEKEELSKEIYDQIVQYSNGLPRNALQTLEQVLSVTPEYRLEVAKRTEEQVNLSIDLCKALMNRKSWKEVKGILLGLKDQDAESVRRVVLGYSQGTLLRGENDRAALIIEEFWEPFYNIGAPGLTYACYSVIKNG